MGKKYRVILDIEAEDTGLGDLTDTALKEALKADVHVPDYIHCGIGEHASLALKQVLVCPQGQATGEGTPLDQSQGDAAAYVKLEVAVPVTEAMVDVLDQLDKLRLAEYAVNRLSKAALMLKAGMLRIEGARLERKRQAKGKKQEDSPLTAKEEPGVLPKPHDDVDRPDRW